MFRLTLKLELPARNMLQTCPYHAFPSVSMLKVLRAVCLLQIDVAEEQKRGRAAVFQLTVFHGRCEDGRGCCCLKPGLTKIYRLDDLFSMTQNELLSEVGGQRSLVPSGFCRTESIFGALWWRSGRMQVKAFPDCDPAAVPMFPCLCLVFNFVQQFPVIRAHSHM